MDTEILKSFPGFESIEESLLRELAERAEIRDCDDGDFIFKEGDSGDAGFFVIQGMVRVEKSVDSQKSETRTLNVLSAGEFFGEMSLIDRSPRSASAVAQGPVQLMQISRASFESLLSANSTAAVSFLFAMIRRQSQRIRLLSSTVVVYHEIGKVIGESKDLSSLLQVILRQLCDATGGDSGFVLLKSPFKEELELGSQLNCELQPEHHRRLAQGEGVIGAVLKSEDGLLIHNFKAQAKSLGLDPIGFEMTSMMVLPVAAGSVNLGVVLLGHSEPKRFDPKALNLCAGVALQAAQAILNARHREEEASRSKLSKRFVRF